ncbi:hypothetical protein EOA32_12360 [Mesorhizobium sp. M1A.F.Ca.ET.072.01.1.1]|uniref:hypothetical protein n=1 Tax=Mesorhizobium sp. M1A.F.Ca.ET.072.01.1.1 TaxID=2496753 RepID=UPI000FD273D7|nr:hypothetical protein [Mesorhizobium sp. M1A.F.Ca.ET.072.01.1.1]RUW52578.1 hypothetical protein EOA32_12360 [Mesorhizobium sp. M1A.F.Ca.ET.072.01.1.1]TIV02265.1 MAG: hypothetical protein E5W04_14170 [Mesorhizobium sp.]
MNSAKARFVVSRLTVLGDQVFNWGHSHRASIRNLGLIVAISIFAGGLLLAIQSMPGLFERLNAIPFVFLVMVAVPATAALNALELQIMAAMAKKNMAWANAFEIGVFSSAANMLFLPAGLLSRAAALRAHGVGLRFGGSLILFFMALWFGAAFGYSGLFLLALGHMKIGAGFATVGLLCTGASIVFLVRLRSGWRLVVSALAIKLAGLILEAFRLCLAASALGIGLGFNQASTFSIASIIGTLTSLVPAGLGITEAITALLSPLADIDSVAGFLIAGTNRIAVVLGLLLLAVILVGTRRLRSLSD